MTRVLLAAVVVAQVLDLATWSVMPRAAEINPIARGLHSETAWLLKGLAVFAAIAIQPALLKPALRRPILGRRVPAWVYREVGDLLIVVAIAAGFLGAGSNIAALSWVAGL
jgi:hypothetical protein